MSRDKNPTVLAKLGDASLGGARQQRKRERTCDGDDGGDSDAESAGKRTHSGAGGEEGTEVGRERSNERSKDVDIHEVGLQEAGAGGVTHEDGVTNEDIMRVLRSIKDSLPRLNALNLPRNLNLPVSGAGNVPVPSNSTIAAHGQHTWLAQESAGPSTLPSASEEALGALLKSGRDLPVVPPQGKGDAFGDKMTDDPRIGQIGDMTDDSHWDSLDADSVEEVFKEMWAAMHPTIALAEGEDEPAGASTDGGKRTSKRPLTLQAKKKYIRRNVKVALDGVRAKLQVCLHHTVLTSLYLFVLNSVSQCIALPSAIHACFPALPHCFLPAFTLPASTHALAEAVE